MTHFIENSYLKVGVKEFGCEITSIVSQKNGYEFLWQGDPSVWAGQSPILFPIIGRLIEDKYTLDGKEYTMPKHGFARKLPWKLLSKAESSMSFILCENKETLACYPFSFNLVVTYTLDKNRLTVSHEVINKNNRTMYFSIGAHPAFNCEIGDKIVFDEKETVDKIKIDLAHSLRLPETFPLLRDEQEIIITADVFNEDALIMKGIKSENASLVRKDGTEKISFNLGKAPYLGIWAKPGAPYVCIEPWYGVNDSRVKKDDFSQKTGIQAITPDEKFNFTWFAEFSE